MATAGATFSYAVRPLSRFSQTSRQVLTLEGALEDLPYILPAPERHESEAQPEEPAATSTNSVKPGSGAGTGETSAEGTAAIGSTGDDWANGGLCSEGNTASCSGRSSGSRVSAANTLCTPPRRTCASARRLSLLEGGKRTGK